jgi:putative spermidine/putrescine transport system substrate-binding protein
MGLRAKPQRNWLLFCGLASCGWLLLAGCGKSSRESQTEATGARITVDSSWSQVQSAGANSTVRIAMWDGDPLINQYMAGWVAEQVQRQHGLRLEFVPLNGQQLVNRMLVDVESGRAVGELDVVWINGETFFQLRQMRALWGPFTACLPNAALLNLSDPSIALDFQLPTDGYECPWGSVQQAWIYHAERVTRPPQTLTELTAWIQQHPGRFTFDVSFTGLTFLKSLLLQFADEPEQFSGRFDEVGYRRAADRLWEWVRLVRPQLWREGRTFPQDVAQLHALLLAGEVDFSMSNNDGEVDNKVREGILPAAAQAYVPEFGSIRNSHYLGIAQNSANPAGAMLLINFLISPEAQLEKQRAEVWGDGTVLDVPRLSTEWQVRFAAAEQRERVPARSELRQRARTEPPAEVMLRLHQELRREILETATGSEQRP